jgi:hypothetical protein
VLADYGKRRDRNFRKRPDVPFLVNKNGKRLDKGEVHRTFYAVSANRITRGESWTSPARHAPSRRFPSHADSSAQPQIWPCLPESCDRHSPLEVGIIRMVFSELATKPEKEKMSAGRFLRTSRGG